MVKQVLSFQRAPVTDHHPARVKDRTINDRAGNL